MLEDFSSNGKGKRTDTYTILFLEEQHFVMGARGQSCHSLTPFVLEERGLKRHFQQTSLVVVVRGLNCCDQTSFDEE
ncbi:hypothetical protein Tco_0760442 [Tanacetum coccineum]